MNDRLLGMYVHMHWGYNYPYAARTWRLEDWRAYLTGLRRLGFNLVQIWPMIDTMPVPPTPSDPAQLEKLRGVIDIAHALGMRVYVGASANTMGNRRAKEYGFEERPYFAAERRIDPRDKDEVAELIAARRTFVEPLAQADGFWIIDSDPGGYPGSSPREFVQLLELHRNMLDRLRPGIALLYWMWQGWTDEFAYCPGWTDNVQPCWREALEQLVEVDPAPWGILACWKGHFAAAAELGLTSKTLYFPYGAIESEPSFPFTHWESQDVAAAFTLVSPDRYPLGVMGNAQSHCLQLPHTYLFQQMATGATLESVDLQAFGEGVMPGWGHVLARAWKALGGADWRVLVPVADALAEIPPEVQLPRGKWAGLCFGQVDRLVEDLKALVALKTQVLRLREELAQAGEIDSVLKSLLPPFENWAKRHGFTDRYIGAFRELLHPLLYEVADKVKGGAQLSKALNDFNTGSPHGALIRLLDEVRSIVLAMRPESCADPS